MKSSYGSSCEIVGILNMTPDSFYDGGRFFSKEKAIDRAYQLIDEGADMIDVGGESTRPGSERISAEDECGRVIPVIEYLAGKIPVPISIDTTKSAVARAAIDAGADVVNDISGFTMDPAMVEVIANSHVRYVLTHIQGTPKEMQERPVYQNVIEEICNFFKKQIALAEQNGIGSERLILDPGIGFGKTVFHNLEILRSLKTFGNFGLPLLIGASRKSFMGHLLNDSGPEDRLGQSLACAVWSYLQGVRFFRVHDVLETKKALRLYQSIEKGIES
jgi:dihydropteroate synthase